MELKLFMDLIDVLEKVAAGPESASARSTPFDRAGGTAWVERELQAANGNGSVALDWLRDVRRVTLQASDLRMGWSLVSKP